MASGFVMFAVGDLPREIGNKQGRVADPSNSIVQALRRREGLMSTFVRQDPQTRAKTSLYESIGCPQNGAKGGRRNVLRSQECVEEVEGEGEGGNVSSHIAQATDGRAFETVSGNGVPDLFDGEVWDLELVAIGVEHLAIALVEDWLRVKGGQRCAGWRVPWSVIGRG